MGHDPIEAKKNMIATLRFAVVALIGLLLAISLAGRKSRMALSENEFSTTQREVASQPYPKHPRLKDEDEILEKYRDYLAFVVSAARNSRSAEASSMVEQFRKLERESPTYAARFLKGLKMELDEKVELLGVAPNRLSSAHPQIQPWVNRYIGTWVRELDEARFRAYTDKLIAKRRRE